MQTGAKGTASVGLDLDRKRLSWKLEYSGLSGPVTSARFSGPAPGSGTTKQAVSLRGGLGSPASGSEELTDNQVEDLVAGLWSINLRTSAHPNGEICGQIVATK